MNIDKIIFSGDGSYYIFWEHVSEIMTKVLKIQPVLFFITEQEETDFYEDKYGLVKKVKMPLGYGSGSIAQIYRLYGTKFFPNEVCLISDLDMILFNRKWLLEKVQNFKKDELVILNSDAYDSKRTECFGNVTRYPMCYLVGTGDVFNKIINTNRSIEDFAKEVFDTNCGWDSDEVFFTNKLLSESHGVKYNLVPRGYSSLYYAPGRIEKYMFGNPMGQASPDWEMHKLNLRGTINYDSFIDCHVWKYGLSILEKIKTELIEYYK